MMRIYLYLLTGFLLVSCDPPSKLPPLENASGVIAPQKARVTIYRPDSDIFRTPDVTVNDKGKPLAEHEVLIVDVPLGAIEIVSRSWDGGNAYLSLDLKNTDHYYFRMRDSTPWFVFEPVAASIARQEIAQLKKQ